MPIAPNRPCKKPGCGALTKKGFCEDHADEAGKRKYVKAKQYDTRRDPNVKIMLNSKRYKETRLRQLRKYPLCAICSRPGKLKKATVLDHKIPHKGDVKLFWDTKNHQSLCVSCHSTKTNKYDGGFGNKQRGDS